jgi:D-alanyl-D-alanine carboxypeptidase
VGGSVERFVQLMNDQARALGLSATTYKNPEGLTEPGHITTARDLATLATRLMRDHADLVGYYAIKKYRYPGTPATNDTNRNDLFVFGNDDRVLVVSRLDNLGKGASGAAVQCMNLMLGFEESTALIA